MYRRRIQCHGNQVFTFSTGIRVRFQPPPQQLQQPTIQSTANVQHDGYELVEILAFQMEICFMIASRVHFVPLNFTLQLQRYGFAMHCPSFLTTQLHQRTASTRKIAARLTVTNNNNNKDCSRFRIGLFLFDAVHDGLHLLRNGNKTEHKEST